MQAILTQADHSIKELKKLIYPLNLCVENLEAPSFDFVVPLIEKHNVSVCLDVGHLRVGAEMLGLDELRAARLMAPYTRSVHLWTTRGRHDVRRYHHIPVHPSLTPADGWIDVPQMLELILTCSPQCAIVFEPGRLYNADPDWQAEGMAWVQGLVAGRGA